MSNGFFYAAITVAIGLVAAGIAYGIIRWLKQKAETTATQLDNIILKSVGTPLVIGIIAISLYVALTRYGLVPETLGEYGTDQVINAIFILLAAWIVSVFCQNFIRTYGEALADITDRDINRLVPILLVSVRYLIWFITFLLLLANFHINITPLLAAAGIAGIAVALAAQDILGNLFGGVVIAFDKPVRIGDRVKTDTFFGDVVHVGARSTRIKTMDNQIVTIPNSTITSKVVINYSLPDCTQKVRIPFSVAYHSDLDKVTEVLLAIGRDAAEKTPWVLSDPAPEVYFLEFGESGISGQLLVWTNNYDNAWDVQNWLIKQISRRFRQEKIEMPFRQVDVWMRNDRDS